MLQEAPAQKMVLEDVQAGDLHLRIDNTELHAQQGPSLQEELEAENAAKAEAAQVASSRQTCCTVASCS